MLGIASLKIKLVAAFLVVASLVVVPSYFSLRAINYVHHSFSDIVDDHVPRLNVLQAMRLLAAKIDNSTTLYVQDQSVSDTEAAKNTLLTDLGKLTDQEHEYSVLTEQGSRQESGAAAVAASFKPVKVAKDATAAAAFALVGMKEQKAAPELIAAKEAELVKAEVALARAIDAAIEKHVAAINVEDKLADEQMRQFSMITLLVAALAGVVALLLGILISVRIAGNLRKLKDGSARISSGDFSHQIVMRSRDELGQLASSFNQMSESLRASYRRLDFEKQRDETLLESMSDGLVAIDGRGQVVLVNSRAVDLLDLDGREEQRGRPVDAILVINAEDDYPLPPENHPAKIAIATMTAISSVYTFHKKDARKILINISTSPVILEGKAAGVTMVIRDVTHEREVDRMKTEFISLASHQLRTPLSAIKWFSEMLLSGDAGKLTPEQNEFARNVADSTERMIDLVNSLLNISRIESGRIMIEPRPTDLSELVSGIVNDLKGKTEERQQTLIVSVHKELPKMNLDPRLIGQVYLNLLTNAIKYTPKGGEISVFVSRKGEELVSQVTDNGYGIPKDQQPKMFQKFFRATNVAKVEPDGTGLGLYLIKAVIESSGGKIWFESEEGKGTTFWFSLPMSGMKRKEGEVTLDG